ncbi:hypothetical protein ACJIZ3_012423 [Penstemon smallii]|uniref:EngB-type G domain-containing protein n=1 Tax=Penstemon smallii TaxID=265156 RepID=A0ABD3UNJ0_9LAMI
MPLKTSPTNGDTVRVRSKVKFSVDKLKGPMDGVRTLKPKNSNANKADRKERVDARKPRASNDGVRTLQFRDADEAHRKVGVDIGKSKRSSDGVRTLEPKKRGTKKVQSKGNGDDFVPYDNVNEKLSKFRGKDKRELKTKSRNDGFESGQKRKRTYADPEMVEDKGDVKRLVKKFTPRSMKTLVGSYIDKGKKAPRGKACEFEDSGENTSPFTGNRKFKGSELRDKKDTGGKMNGSYKLKNVQEKLRDGASKTSDKRIPHLATKKDPDHRKYTIDSVERSRKSKVQCKKSLATHSELTDRPPKKKKRGIRIDPHDTSNKRLDDDITNNGNTQEKKDLADSEVEISKNAQFRAIRPSSSILSFVDDNLLGRRREIEFRRAGYNIELPAPLDNIPFSTSSERERIEVPVFRNRLEFFAAAKISSSFPPPDLPEIAFAGRSNVGKSSLLNGLTRQWGVARTSDKPGLTQTINFFKLGPKLCLVDLPGYGFAYAKEEVKENWEELVKEYVDSRVALKRVCLLVDTKWGLKPRDHELIDLMERSQTKYQIVLTKTDLVFPIDVARRAMQIEENLKAKKSAVQPLMMVSSKTGAGMRSLRTVLANIARFAK